MAQVSRAIKRTFLQAMPSRVTDALLRKYPNLRKAAPAGHAFVFDGYCSDIRVNIDTRYKVERIMWSGIYEPRLVGFLRTQHTSGWACLDIGANVGAISLLLAKLVGPQGRVFAVEPGPPNVTRLRKNFELNPALAARAEIVPCGISDAPGQLWWAEEDGNPGNAMLGDQGTHCIPVTTIDNVVHEHAIQKLDFVKIDVEGMELQVMHGGEKTLQRFRPILYFETLSRYGDAHEGSNFELIDSFLVRDCNYKLFSINSSGQLSPLRGSVMDDYTVAIHASMTS
jgi:FkbM family methyltransferase